MHSSGEFKAATEQFSAESTGTLSRQYRKTVVQDLLNKSRWFDALIDKALAARDDYPRARNEPHRESLLAPVRMIAPPSSSPPPMPEEDASSQS